MSVPGAVQAALGDEQVAARVSLGGEDELYVTPTRTLIYRGEGLLSDESIDEYPHDAEQITVSEGRRKTKITLEYPIDGPSEFAVPNDRLQDALHPVIAGVLNAANVTEPGERVKETFRFSELTLVVTSDRLVKHVGEAVWGEGHEEYHYDDVTDLTFEEGSVATQVVLEVGGRPQRIKAPNDQAEKVRQTLQGALLAYHDVGSLPELREALGTDEDDEDESDDPVTFGEGVDPLGSTGDDAEPDAISEVDDVGVGADAGAGADAEESAVAEVAAGDEGGSAGLLDPDGGVDAIADAGADASGDAETSGGAGAAGDDGADAGGATPGDAAAAAAAGSEASAGGSGVAADADVAEELAALREAVEEQNRQLEEHQRVLKQLVERLSGGQ